MDFGNTKQRKPVQKGDDSTRYPSILTEGEIYAFVEPINHLITIPYKTPRYHPHRNPHLTKTRLQKLSVASMKIHLGTLHRHVQPTDRFTPRLFVPVPVFFAREVARAPLSAPESSLLSITAVELQVLVAVCSV